MNATVTCDKHGTSPAAFVCVHLVESLRDSVARGVSYERDEDGQINGFCDVCDGMLADNNDEWTDALEAQADARVICEECFLAVIRLNDKPEVH